MSKLAVYEKQMLASPHQQISDRSSRSIATSGRGSDVVGYNVQVAVDAEHQLDRGARGNERQLSRAQLGIMAKQAKGVLKTETLKAVAGRGYFSSREIVAGCSRRLPKS